MKIPSNFDTVPTSKEQLAILKRCMDQVAIFEGMLMNSAKIPFSHELSIWVTLHKFLSEIFALEIMANDEIEFPDNFIQLLREHIDKKKKEYHAEQLQQLS